MSLPKFARHTIVFVEPGVKIVFGAKTDDWSEAAVKRREVRRCYAEAVSTEELADRGRDTTIDVWRVLLPAKTPAPASNARVILPNGLEYEIEGNVRPVESASGRLNHLRFECERTVNRG